MRMIRVDIGLDISWIFEMSVMLPLDKGVNSGFIKTLNCKFDDLLSRGNFIIYILIGLRNHTHTRAKSHHTMCFVIETSGSDTIN